MIDPKHYRAARAMLDLTIAELAENTGLSRDTVHGLELGKPPRQATIKAIHDYYARHGLEFTPRGVLEANPVRVLKGEDSFMETLNDVAETLASGGEMLAENWCDRFSPDSVKNKMAVMRESGIRMRFTVESNDDFLLYPSEEYRALPSEHFLNCVVLIYGGKMAISTDENGLGMTIISDRALATAQRRKFNLLWDLLPKVKA